MFTNFLGTDRGIWSCQCCGHSMWIDCKVYGKEEYHCPLCHHTNTIVALSGIPEIDPEMYENLVKRPDSWYRKQEAKEKTAP